MAPQSNNQVPVVIEHTVPTEVLGSGSEMVPKKKKKKKKKKPKVRLDENLQETSLASQSNNQVSVVIEHTMPTEVHGSGSRDETVPKKKKKKKKKSKVPVDENLQNTLEPESHNRLIEQKDHMVRNEVLESGTEDETVSTLLVEEPKSTVENDFAAPELPKDTENEKETTITEELSQPAENVESESTFSIFMFLLLYTKLIGIFQNR